MGKVNNSRTPQHLSGRIENPYIRARRLLGRLKIPSLFIASELPHSHSPFPLVPPTLRHAKEEVERISRGRLTLVDRKYLGDNRRHKIYDHQCCHYFWMSLSQLKCIGTKNACPYENMPTDLQQIGGLRELQNFVSHRSLGAVYLQDQNTIGTFNDIYDFYCARCCIPFEAPFVYFLRFSPESNACPSCMAKETNHDL